MSDFGSLFGGIPHWLAVALIAMVPIAELRGAIPVGIEVYGLSWPAAFTWALVGNIVAVALVLWLLEPASGWLMRQSQTMRRFFDWLFARTRQRMTASFARWGAIALVAFVAIPLPLTGGLTGAVAAFVFSVPRWQAFGLVSLGVFIAGVIVTIVTVGLTSII